jgi:hypothetical protein
MKHKLLYSLMFGTILVITGCAGGGGGGGGANPPGNTPPTPGSGPSSVTTPTSSYARSEVPFATPVLAAVVAPLVGTSAASVVAETYTANIDNAGGQNIIIAGRESQPSTPQTWSNSKISMLGWENGQLVDKTVQ